MFSNYPSFDSLPSASHLKPVLIATAYASSQIGNYSDGGNIINADENTKWASKGKGESISIDLSETVPIKRIDIQWDPALPRTGSFEVGCTVEGSAEPTASGLFYMNSMLWSSVEYDDPPPVASVITIICFGNRDDDRNGITHVKIYSIGRAEE